MFNFKRKRKIDVTGNKVKTLDWTNISLGKYIELQDLLLYNEEQLEGEDLVMQQIQILYDKNPYTMTMPEFNQCLKGLDFFKKPMPKMKVKEQYNLGGNVYYLHKELSEFKVGQYIDYQQIMKRYKEGDVTADFIALFLTPSKDDSYGDGYDVKDVIKDIKQYMSIADASSIAAFFLRLSKAFTLTSLWYSHRKMKKTVKDRKAKKELTKKMKELMKMVLRGV